MVPRRRRRPRLPPPTTRGEVVASIGSEGGFDAQRIYKEEAPGVVTILSSFGTEGGEGSGFVLNEDGDIVTNAHVVTTGEGAAIRRASEVYVEFADGNRVAAKVLGHDPNADIALLRVDPKGLSLRPLPLGESESVTVGSPVAAIGSPFGQAQSLSVGIVSAIDRSVASLTDFAIARGDPDRRGDQSRQLRRAARRLRRPRDRHQPADPEPLGRR